MAGKGRKFTLLVLIVAAFAATGCTPPFGSIGEMEGSIARPSGFDGIEAVPVPAEPLYETSHVFRRDTSHLRVFTTLNGERQIEVYPGSCDVYVIEKRGTSSEKRNSVGSGYELKEKGPNVIYVEYQNFHDEYTITVEEPEDPGDGGNTNSSPGIHIIWPT